MKILAFTDLHSNLKLIGKLRKKAQNAELVVCTGDFTFFQKNIVRVLAEIDKIGKKVLLINGNHEDDEEVKRLCMRLKNIVFLHKSSYTHKSRDKTFLFAGYGGMGFSLRDRDFELSMKKFIGKSNLVLLTHAPPYGTRLDAISSYHGGSRSITSFIKKAGPLLAVCGHFHENFGKKDRIGKTVLVNPGPEGRIIEV